MIKITQRTIENLPEYSFKELCDSFLYESSDDTTRKTIPLLLKRKILSESFSFAPCFYDFIYLYKIVRIYNIENNLKLSKYNDNKRKRVTDLLTFINEFFKEKYKTNDSLFIINEKEIIYDNLFELYLHMYGALNLEVAKLNGVLAIDFYINPFLNEITSLFDSLGKIVFAYKYALLSMKYQFKIPSYFLDIIEIDSFPEKLKLYIKNNTFKNDDFDDANITKEKAVKYLENSKNILESEYISSDYTPKSKNFYLLANEIMEYLNESPFMDYSIVSLQYYKIIEIEIKDKIIQKAASDLPNGEFEFGQHIGYKTNKITIDNNKSFINKMTLGQINKLFIDVKNNKKLSIIQEKFYKNILKITKCDIFLDFLIKVTDDKLLRIFRNPPAHTEPLEKKDALVMRKILLNFNLNMAFVNVGYISYIFISKIIEEYLANS